ncbi:hypothetical protein ABW20_dc0104035 [Dactylellina cionopaga]|nr:hypothetical protein ABW20_dc0104035 [Dactylellina cionopaga]
MKGKCSCAWLLQLLLLSLTSSPDTTFAALISGTSESKQPTVTIGSSLGITTCPFRTANYITHGLPQQCLRASRVVSANATGRLEVSDNGVLESPSVNSEVGLATTATVDFGSKYERASSLLGEFPPSTEDAETPLDTANFLSFEEWKEQNLAKAGQSAENFGERPPKEARRRPGSMSSALDALGEDAEIDLNFGEGEEKEGGVNVLNEAKPSETLEPKKHVRSKDAGKTCKERFNYASFDCAATVHKTNPESKGASAILVENKDSYMLNKCGAKNKFIIVELCDDILVDTVVLANYEFFSSMLRTFRVSVSDRYPVKSAGWKDLGVFEAKNSREIQAFLIVNPLIWARYIRIEFLSHFGKEFYCPISLLRVHGTTMMEEFRHQEELARGYNEDEAEEMEPEAVAEPIEEAAKEQQSSREAEAESYTAVDDGVIRTREIVPAPQSTISMPPDSVGPALADPTNGEEATSSEADEGFAAGSERQEKDLKPSSQTGQSASSTPANSISKDDPSEADHTITGTPASDKVASNPSQTREATPPRNSSSTVPENRPPSAVSSAAPTPTTQENFFKTIHKRLQLLEANATLSLQYIEEQSRLMRDTFSRMEKRQFNKSASYLDQLNGTVFRELREFRAQYDQLWQSTVIALDTQRELSEREIIAISARLTMLADEIVFQKRMTIAQSFLMILVVCLVVFSKTQNLEAGLVRTVFPSRSQDHLGLESPPTSPSPPRVRPNKSGRAASHRRRLKEYQQNHQRADSSDMEIPIMTSMKRTPIPANFYEDRAANLSTLNISDTLLDEIPVSPPLLPQVTQSSPATPSGLNTMKERNWVSSASDGEYATPDTASMAGGRWRASSPLSNQITSGAEEEEEEEEEELPEVKYYRLKYKLDLPQLPEKPPAPVPPKLYKTLLKQFSDILVIAPATNTPTGTPSKRARGVAADSAAAPTPKKTPAWRSKDLAKLMPAKSGPSADKRIQQYVPLIQELCATLSSDFPGAALHVTAGMSYIFSSAKYKNLTETPYTLLGCLYVVVVKELLGEKEFGELGAREKRGWYEGKIKDLYKFLKGKGLTEERETIWKEEFNKVLEEAAGGDMRETRWFMDMIGRMKVDMGDNEDEEGGDEEEEEEEGVDIAKGEERSKDMGMESGIGSMIQDRLDFLSDKRKKAYSEWKADALRRIAQLEA